MIKATAHTHTTFCDGENTAEEMVNAAIALGFNALGFSSHSFCRYYEVGISDENIAEYEAEIERLKKKYKGKISLYTGIELDPLSVRPNFAFDYIIGSVHYIMGQNGKHYCIDNGERALALALSEGFCNDSDALCEAYFAAIDEMLTSIMPNICGHYDLLRCSNGNNKVLNLSTERYKAAALKTLRKHAKNVIFEINTGGVARGRQPLPYPELFILQELCALGGKIMINSDTHAVGTINAGYEQAQELAIKAGFKTVWALTDDGIKELALN